MQVEQDQRTRSHQETQKILNDLQEQSHPVPIIT